MINILFTTSKLGNGGAERQLINLLKGIDKNKFNPVLIVMHDKGEKLNEVMSLGIPVYFVLRKWRWDIFRVIEFISIIKKNNISIVHTWDKMGSFFIFLSRLFAKFIWINGTIRCGEHRIEFRMLIRRLLLKAADYRIANSHNGIAAFGFKPGETTFTIYNGINPPMPQINPEDLLSSFGIKRKNILCTIGRLEFEKDFPGLLEILKRIKYEKHRDDFILFIIGNGSRLNELQKLTEKFGLRDEVIFTGYVSNVSDYLQVSKVFLLLSYNYHGEGFPNVLGEAMYFGVPSIVSDNGGNSEIIENNLNGFLCKVNDYDDILNKIFRITDNNDEWVKISTNSKMRIQNEFSFEKMVSNYQKFYEKIS